MPIICAEELSLVNFANSFKEKKVFFTLILLLFESCLIFLLITDFAAPFFIASFTNL